MAFFLHQDNLMWNRLQTMGVIQIGTLSAAYGLKSNRVFSACILALGVILTLCVFFLLKRDEVVRMRLEEQLDSLDYNVDRKWYAPLKGREIAWILLAAIILSDFMLIVAIIFQWI